MFGGGGGYQPHYGAPGSAPDIRKLRKRRRQTRRRSWLFLTLAILALAGVAFEPAHHNWFLTILLDLIWAAGFFALFAWQRRRAIRLGQLIAQADPAQAVSGGLQPVDPARYTR